MQVLTAAEMKAADRATVERFGSSFERLMENAGRAVAEAAGKLFPKAERILVIAGKGNNGGDGLVAARCLSEAGRAVRVLLLAPRESVQGQAAIMLDRFTGEVRVAANADKLEDAEKSGLFRDADLIVDAVFGTGFRPPLDAFVSRVKGLVNASPARVLAVDLPSGWDADSDAAHAEAFRADAVVTFTAPKPAHVFGEMSTGPILVADIGSPAEAVQSQSQLTFTGTSLAKFQTPRARDNNKGRFGHVLVIGGAEGKAGAPSMSALACMRTGAGLTTAAIVKSILPTVARIAPELMTVPLAETSEGAVAAGNADSEHRERLLDKITVLAMGPGLGQSTETQEFVHKMVANSAVPLVLDADGLNAYDAGKAKELRGGKRVLVLTPHPGEMARLLGVSVKEVEADRTNIARKFATEHELILVLKGWRTLVAHPDGRVAVNTTGNPGMAKGGSGDLLTGMVAAMLAQSKAYGATPGEAVEAAVYLHGLSADMCVAGGDEHTLLATDALEFLARGYKFRVQQDGWTWLQGF